MEDMDIIVHVAAKSFFRNIPPVIFYMLSLKKLYWFFCCPVSLLQTLCTILYSMWHPRLNSVWDRCWLIKTVIHIRIFCSVAIRQLIWRVLISYFLFQLLMFFNGFLFLYATVFIPTWIRSSLLISFNFIHSSCDSLYT